MDSIIGAAEKAAKERQQDGGGDKKSEKAKAKNKSVVELIPQVMRERAGSRPITESMQAEVPVPIGKKSRDEAGKVLGVNGKYLDAAKKIKREAPSWRTITQQAKP